MSPISNPALIPPGAATPTPPPAGATGRTPARKGGPAAGPPAGGTFADALATASGPPQGAQLHFSRHALQRVQRRGVSLDPSTLGRLSEGVARAAGKGSRDSVVLVDGTAFVVSVSNRTVLTAVPPERMREQVFTNIDSAVIA